ncbi:iron ABC transporter ATP-binding protein [Clostridia bacterium]|nr:iron ABC transporter ATP-binding protein [Clostridia bacterium]
MIEVEQACFAYPKEKDILHDLSFQVSEGEVLSIIGKNGVGKTTLLRCLLGFLPWRSGRTLLDGKDIREWKTEQLWKKVAYVAQRKQSVVYTVEEMVLLGRSMHRKLWQMPTDEDRAAAKEALEYFGLVHLMGKVCSKLSGGQMQMVNLARAIATKATLLVWDEPEANLDLANQYQVLSSITHLQKEKGLSFVINTHTIEHSFLWKGKSVLLYPDAAYLFGSTVDVLTQENLSKAFSLDLQVHRIEKGSEEYHVVLPTAFFGKSRTDSDN